MPDPVVLVATEGGVATITLNRPEALNALNRELTLGLREAVFAAENDASVRCLVIRGGEHFMAGGDLKWFHKEVGSRDSAQLRVQDLIRRQGADFPVLSFSGLSEPSPEA